MNKKENITDLILPEAFDDPTFKKGLVLKFTGATIKVTRVDRKNKQVWGEHIILVNSRYMNTHDAHDVFTDKVTYDEYGMPFCNDCQVAIDQPSTEDGEVKALNRGDTSEQG